MIDRESVIRQLTQHIARAENIENDWMDCVSIPMLRGALELLKEQEPVEPKEIVNEHFPVGNYRRTIGWLCGKCGKALMGNGVYCSYCGKKVKWE